MKEHSVYIAISKNIAAKIEEFHKAFCKLDEKDLQNNSIALKEYLNIFYRIFSLGKDSEIRDAILEGIISGDNKIKLMQIYHRFSQVRDILISIGRNMAKLMSKLKSKWWKIMVDIFRI